MKASAEKQTPTKPQEMSEKKLISAKQHTEEQSRELELQKPIKEKARSSELKNSPQKQQELSPYKDV
jgi:hypothetical protein